MIGRIHPEILAEQAEKRLKEPLKCLHAWGFIHPSASRPRASWCVRPLGHAGHHMNEKRYAEYRELAKERQRRKRGRVCEAEES